MKKGQVAYIEAINKQGSHTDTMSVGVELPNGDKLFPIPHDLLRKTKTSATGDSLFHSNFQVPFILYNLSLS